MATSAITLAEFPEGPERARGATALETARLWADVERCASKLTAFDLLIATTARSRGWALATAEVRDFAGLELARLRVE